MTLQAEEDGHHKLTSVLRWVFFAVSLVVLLLFSIAHALHDPFRDLRDAHEVQLVLLVIGQALHVALVAVK